jgi:hypothetical protein
VILWSDGRPSLGCQNPSFPPQAIASDAGLLADLIQTLRHTEEKKTEWGFPCKNGTAITECSMVPSQKSMAPSSFWASADKL